MSVNWRNMTAEEQILQGLPEDRRAEFSMRYNATTGKNWLVYALLAGFPGGLGAHRFYMREYVWGGVYLALERTGFPSAFGAVEAFFAGDKIRLFKAEIAARIAHDIRIDIKESKLFPNPADWQGDAL